MKVFRYHSQKGIEHLVYCPACDTLHFYEPDWEFDGDFVNPTLSPSLNIERADGSRCHIVVYDGMMKYEPDSTHEYAGRTIPLQHFPPKFVELTKKTKISLS